MCYTGRMTSAASKTNTLPPRSARSKRVPKRMTLREFAAFEADQPEKWELIEGVPYITPSPTGPHNDLAAELRTLALRCLKPSEEWYVVLDASVRLEPTASEVRPDVAVYRKGELKDPEQLPYRALPALVIECLSPSTAARDMDSKRTLYCKLGIPEYWIVDPKTGAITLFTLIKGAYEQLSVDPKGFIKATLLKRKLRIVVKPWTFEILEA